LFNPSIVSLSIDDVTVALLSNGTTIGSVHLPVLQFVANATQTLQLKVWSFVVLILLFSHAGVGRVANEQRSVDCR
jgi:hypothetical protein